MSRKKSLEMLLKAAEQLGSTDGGYAEQQPSEGLDSTEVSREEAALINPDCGRLSDNQPPTATLGSDDRNNTANISRSTSESDLSPPVGLLSGALMGKEEEDEDEGWEGRECPDGEEGEGEDRPREVDMEVEGNSRNLSHNRKERERRKDLKQSVLKLRNQLRKRTKRPSTISVLRAAESEIKELTAKEKMESRRLDAIKRRHGFLTMKLESLSSDFKKSSSPRQIPLPSMVPPPLPCLGGFGISPFLQSHSPQARPMAGPSPILSSPSLISSVSAPNPSTLLNISNSMPSVAPTFHSQTSLQLQFPAPLHRYPLLPSLLPSSFPHCSYVMPVPHMLQPLQQSASQPIVSNPFVNKIAPATYPLAFLRPATPSPMLAPQEANSGKVAFNLQGGDQSVISRLSRSDRSSNPEMYTEADVQPQVTSKRWRRHSSYDPSGQQPPEINEGYLPSRNILEESEDEEVIVDDEELEDSHLHNSEDSDDSDSNSSSSFHQETSMATGCDYNSGQSGRCSDSSSSGSSPQNTDTYRHHSRKTATTASAWLSSTSKHPPSIVQVEESSEFTIKLIDQFHSQEHMNPSLAMLKKHQRHVSHGTSMNYPVASQHCSVITQHDQNDKECVLVANCSRKRKHAQICSNGSNSHVNTCGRVNKSISKGRLMMAVIS